MNVQNEWRMALPWCLLMGWLDLIWLCFDFEWQWTIFFEAVTKVNISDAYEYSCSNIKPNPVSKVCQVSETIWNVCDPWSDCSKICVTDPQKHFNLILLSTHKSTYMQKNNGCVESSMGVHPPPARSGVGGLARSLCFNGIINGESGWAARTDT